MLPSIFQHPTTSSALLRCLIYYTTTPKQIKIQDQHLYSRYVFIYSLSNIRSLQWASTLLSNSLQTPPSSDFEYPSHQSHGSVLDMMSDFGIHLFLIFSNSQDFLKLPLATPFVTTYFYTFKKLCKNR